MDDDDIGLPIKLGPCSNGEFVPPPPTDLTREVARRARIECEENARRTGMHTTGGVLAVTIVQEGLLRPSMTMPPEFEERMRAMRADAAEA